MGCFDEVKSMNLSLYGQWLGIVSIILLIALGIVGFTSHIVFSIVGWVIAFLLVLVEIPLCLKVSRLAENCHWGTDTNESCLGAHLFSSAPQAPNSTMYLIFAVIMFLSNLLHGATPLIAAAVALLLAALCYLGAAVMGQAFASSRILGGTGTDNVV
ncbi:hypothetical protein [Absidia glauca]|uniref:Golgi apparatus membrane protein TVP18 n=1 Tax=Absidia glauca TaxID=4829 RepID=A0A168PNP0_ABSGL|nr:hypothetical protein [Absidia glauca]